MATVPLAEPQVTVRRAMDAAGPREALTAEVMATGMAAALVKLMMVEAATASGTAEAARATLMVVGTVTLKMAGEMARPVVVLMAGEMATGTAAVLVKLMVAEARASGTAEVARATMRAAVMKRRMAAATARQMAAT